MLPITLIEILKNLGFIEQRGERFYSSCAVGEEMTIEVKKLIEEITKLWEQDND